MSRQLTYTKAINEAMIQEMERDDSVFILGEDVARMGGDFGLTQNIYHRWPDRIFDTALSEAAIVGLANGAAIAGLRPIAEIMFADFAGVAFDQIVNSTAKLNFMFQGEANCPVVIRAPQGAGIRCAYHHSAAVESWFLNTPGLVIVSPATPYEAKGLLISAIRSNDPVLFLEHKMLLNMKGEVPEEPYALPLGKGVIEREGKDVTICALQITVGMALKAAALLEKEGISAEVINLRTIKPYDEALIAESVAKTSRLVVAQEGPKVGGWAAEISAMVSEKYFEYLSAPVGRVTCLDIPVSFAPVLEDYYMLTPDDIVRAAKAAVAFQPHTNRTPNKTDARHFNGGRLEESNMATKEKMPKFGLSMEEGILGEWLVPVGAAVKRGERIAVIEAEKLTNDALATADGVMLKHYLEPGDTAPCGDPICLIGSAGETDGDAPAAPAPAPVSAPRAADCTVDAMTSATPIARASAEKQNVPATPRAQAIIDTRGLDAAAIPATGKNGEITVDDVRAAANAPAPAAPQGPLAITPRAKALAEKLRLSYAHIRGTGLLGMITVANVKAQGKPASESKIIPMNGIQRATAVAMKKSLDATAQTTVCIESPFGALVSAYQRLKPFYAAEGIKLSYTAMIVYAVSRALINREDVRMQYLDERNFALPGGIHIGIAIDTEKGLIVPAVRNADQKSLRTICGDLSDLAARAKSGKLTESDFGGAVTTVTNLAMAGATSFTPILNPPETTILGVCKLRDIPVVKNGGVFVEPVMNLCLTYDHRVLNGAPACRYLQQVTDLINETDWK